MKQSTKIIAKFSDELKKRIHILSEKINVLPTNMAKLTEEAFKECLFKEGEDTTNYVKVEGICATFGLHPQRLEKKRKLVTELLSKLPTEFKNGYTFLAFCITKNGYCWTSEQRVGEQLLVMAIGLGLAEYCLPKEMWSVFPSGVPYVIIK